MATTISAHFEPTTDNFGRLTLRANRRVQVQPTNLLIIMAFFSVLFIVITGLALMDSAIFEHSHAAASYYGPVPLDYD